MNWYILYWIIVCWWSYIMCNKHIKPESGVGTILTWVMLFVFAPILIPAWILFVGIETICNHFEDSKDNS